LISARTDVFWLILRETLWLAFAGMIVGLPIIFTTGRGLVSPNFLDLEVLKWQI